MKAVATLFLAMTVASFVPQSVAYWWPSQVLKRYFGSNEQTIAPSTAAQLYQANGVLPTITLAPETTLPVTASQEVAASSMVTMLTTIEAVEGDSLSRPLLDDNQMTAAGVDTDIASQGTTFTPQAATHSQSTDTVTASIMHAFAPIGTFVSASGTDSPGDGVSKPHTEDLSVLHTATNSSEATEPTPTTESINTSTSSSLLQHVHATLPATISEYLENTTPVVTNEAHSYTSPSTLGQLATYHSIENVHVTEPASGITDNTVTSVANEIHSQTKAFAFGQQGTQPSIENVKTVFSSMHLTTGMDFKILEDASNSAAVTQPDVPIMYTTYITDTSSASNDVTTDGGITGSTMFFPMPSDGTFHTPTEVYTVAFADNFTAATDMAMLTGVNETATAPPQSLPTSKVRSTEYDISITTATGEYSSVTEPEAGLTTFGTSISALRTGTNSTEEIGNVLPATTNPSAPSETMHISTTAFPSSDTARPDNVTPSEENVTDISVIPVVQQDLTSSFPPSLLSTQSYLPHDENDYGATITTTTSTTRRYKPMHVRRFTPWIITRSTSSTPMAFTNPTALTGAALMVVRPQGERDSFEMQQSSTIDSASERGVAPMYKSKNPIVPSTSRATKHPPSDTLVVPQSFFATRALFNRFGRPYCSGCDALLIKLPDRFSLPRLPPYVYG